MEIYLLVKIADPIPSVRSEWDQKSYTSRLGTKPARLTQRTRERRFLRVVGIGVLKLVQISTNTSQVSPVKLPTAHMYMTIIRTLPGKFCSPPAVVQNNG